MFRYNITGTWYKGNPHIHSPASDGGKPFTELAEMYAGAGYDFLFRTDHWVTSDAAGDSVDYPRLWLDGIELDGRDNRRAYYHIVGLGTFSGITREMGLGAALQATREQGGLLILAHPHWIGNSFEQALRWDFDGVEVYNTSHPMENTSPSTPPPYNLRASLGQTIAGSAEATSTACYLQKQPLKFPQIGTICTSKSKTIRANAPGQIPCSQITCN